MSLITKQQKYSDNIWKSFQEQQGQFEQNLAQTNLGWRVFIFLQLKGNVLNQSCYNISLSINVM